MQCFYVYLARHLAYMCTCGCVRVFEIKLSKFKIRISKEMLENCLFINISEPTLLLQMGPLLVFTYSMLKRLLVNQVTFCRPGGRNKAVSPQTIKSGEKNFLGTCTLFIFKW